MINVNMAKAVEIKKDMIREERKPKLEALDVDFIRAVEASDTAAQAEISAQKQALRDVTADPRIDAAKTPDELKAITLETLLG